jgi:polysaccharide pyruvyl transferase WcaK-like protein
MVTRAGLPVIEGILPSPYLDDQGSGIGRNLAAVFRLMHEVLCLALLLVSSVFAPLHPKKARALRELRQASLVIARGGQYLHNESGRLRGLLYLGRMLLNIAVSIWLGRPTIILGLSIGPVHGRLARWCLRETIRSCRHIVVREALSAAYLHSIGISDNVHILPDLGFLTMPDETQRVCAALPDAPRIAVTLINWSFPGCARPRQALARYLDAVFDTLVSCHARQALVPILVLQVSAMHHGQHDAPVVAQLYERLVAAGVPARIVDADLTPAELCFLYSQCEVVLATRLHAAILAACAGTPSVAIRYQGFKTQGVMADLGLARYTHDINALNGEALTESIRHVLDQRTMLPAEIRQRVAYYRNELLSTVGWIAKSTMAKDV